MGMLEQVSKYAAEVNCFLDVCIGRLMKIAVLSIQCKGLSGGLLCTRFSIVGPHVS